VQGVIYLLIGSFTWQAAKSFKAVVQTEGSDIEHLMAGLDKMARVYGLQRWLLLVGIAVLVLAVFVGAVAVAAR
jgi:hypothetical protein